MEEERKVPKLRFPEFTDAWEQRKLGEIANRINRKNSNLSSKLPLTISAEYGLIDQMSFFNKTVASSDLSKYYLIKKGEFAYNKSYSKDYPWGAIKRLDNYEKGVLSTLYIIFDIIELVSNDFMVTYFDSNHWYRQIYLRASEGARNHGLLNISPDDFFDIELNLPKENMEQRKIGFLFQQLDNLITLHQRKLENLKNLKKGLLQKMFPKDGEKFPEIRFPEFTDAWEQRKLGEVTNRFDNLRIPITSSARKKGHTPYYGANGVQDFVDGYTHEGEFVLIAEDGANDINDYPVYLVNGKVWVNNHAHVLQANSGSNNLFLTYILKNVDYGSILVGGGRAKLNADAMMKISIYLPNIKEQQKIGQFFKEIDDIITLHQRKLDNLQKLKKALLQQMFV